MDTGLAKTPFGARQKIAVVGAGISGLSAAWLLSKSADVILYEANDRLGGHSNTALVNDGRSLVPVDTGFIVYNDRNYPNLVKLFDHLDVPTIGSNMSFAASLEGGRFEYSGSGIAGLLGQRTNILRPRFWMMLRDIMRFYREAPELLDRPEFEGMSLGTYLEREGYGASFVEDHLLPMGAAIWSTTASEMRLYPIQAFVRFFVNHGLLSLKDRPQWRTVSGGSREYVARILSDFSGQVRLNSPVASIRREKGRVEIADAAGHVDRFDHVVLATHATESLQMLQDPSRQEQSLLGAFQYTQNTAVLHGDEALMPRRRAVWSSWNYVADADPARTLCVTYWMNQLQSLDTDRQIFVTLNPCREINPQKVYGTFNYEHPLFDTAAILAQKKLWALQGNRNTWFCGAYFGSGFHEDGLQSGLAVAEALGGVRRPWTAQEESGRIFIHAVREAAE